MTMAGCVHAPVSFSVFPPEINGWKPDGPGKEYNADTLYDYIDGSAEVYRSFNVKRVLAQKYVKDGAPDIIADLFDMGSSKDAFGAYHHDMREGPSGGIGAESEFSGSTLAYWKGSCFVSVLAYDESPEAKRTVRDIGERLAQAIHGDSTPPSIIRLLPEPGLVKSHVHYFHTHECLNVHYFLANENLLDLHSASEGVLARYQPEGLEPYVLILLQYPNAAAARTARDRFIKGYMPDAEANGMVRTENGRWTGIGIEGVYWVGVFDAASQPALDRTLSGVLRHVKGK